MDLFLVHPIDHVVHSHPPRLDDQMSHKKQTDSEPKKEQRLSYSSGRQVIVWPRIVLFAMAKNACSLTKLKLK